MNIHKFKNYSVSYCLINRGGKLQRIPALFHHTKNPDGSDFPYQERVREIPLNPAIYGRE